MNEKKVDSCTGDYRIQQHFMMQQNCRRRSPDSDRHEPDTELHSGPSSFSVMSVCSGCANQAHFCGGRRQMQYPFAARAFESSIVALLWRQDTVMSMPGAEEVSVISHSMAFCRATDSLVNGNSDTRIDTQITQYKHLQDIQLSSKRLDSLYTIYSITKHCSSI